MQSESNHGVRGSILFLTLCTGECLSKRHCDVESYLEKRSWTVSSDKSASLEKSSLDSKSCWNTFLSNLLQEQTLNKSKTVIGCTSRRPSINEWSEIDGACTKISGEGWSDRVLKTSRIPLFRSVIWGGWEGRRPPQGERKKKKERKKEKRKKGTMNNVKLLHIKCCFFQFFKSPVAWKNFKKFAPKKKLTWRSCHLCCT